MIKKVLRKVFRAVAAAVVGLCFAVNLHAFTETFGTADFKDTANTTANWDIMNGKAILQRVSKFAQTVDVVNWGGGVSAVEYVSGGQWLIGGIQGKLNSYDGSNFEDITSELSGFTDWNIWAIKYCAGSGVTFIGGDGPSLNRRDGFGPWVNAKTSLIGFSTAVNAIECNNSGSAWLFGGRNGSLNSFNGIATWTDLKSGLNFAPYDVKAIGYNGSYWLIAGTNGRIARFNGSSFTDLTPALYAALGNNYYDIYTLDWNGSYWLLGGGAGRIAVYDGAGFTEKIPGGTQMYSVWSIKWNGAYWLIGGSQGTDQTVLYTAVNANITPYTEQTNPSYFSIRPIWAIGCDEAGGKNLIGGKNGSLMMRTGTYNSPVNVDLSRDALDFGANAVNFAVPNGSYWLVGGVEGSLNRYDGSDFTDLKAYLGWTGENLLCAAYNGTDGYWLIGGTGGKLAKYDGTNFSDRTVQLGFGGAAVRTIKWNGAQWLLGGEQRSLAVSIDGDNFQARDISAYFGAFDSVNKVEWAQSWWFTGGSNGNLILYNGAGIYADLKADLSACLGGSYHVNEIKFDGAARVRIGCNSAKMADYEGGSFVNKSASLVNFGVSDVYAMDYSQSQSQWIIAGKSGAINIATGTGIEVFSDESANLVNFNMAAINTVAYNGDYWVIGGDNAKLNRYGLAYLSPGWAYSTVIDQWFAGYTSVTLLADHTLNGQQISYYLSANDGATWVSAQPGASVSFSGPDNGDKLKWRALLRNFDGIKSPFIDTIIINFDRGIAPTYTITMTLTRTVTTTITATPTVTRTNTATSTSTLTWTQTETKTITATDTRTATRTITDTVTRTATVTPTSTFSPTVTLTQTATYTRTHTPTVTLTGTITPTWSASDTGTMTPTVTVIHTVTLTGTITPTFSYTATITETFTATMTFTHTATYTRTYTITETHTDTITLTLTNTPTITPTWTVSETFTVTMTRTITRTQTVSPTASRTATVTPTPEQLIAVPVRGEVIIYPNPAGEKLNVACYMAEPGKISVRIYNEAGVLAAYKDEDIGAGLQVMTIRINRLAQGVYMCLVSTEYDSGGILKYGVKKLLILH